MGISKAALALCSAIIPPGAILQGFSARHLTKLYDELHHIHEKGPGFFNAACQVLDKASFAYGKKSFSSLSATQQQALIRRWNDDTGPIGSALALITSVVKVVYFDEDELHRHFGVPHNKAPLHDDPLPRYMQRAIPGRDFEEEEIDADIVIIGSGAAGAMLGKELAERGHAVVIIEAGAYYRRKNFTGQALHAFRNFYHWRSQNIVMGNVVIPLPTGQTVGGSTTINTATCFRPPPWVFRRWTEMGLVELSEKQLTPLFDEIEKTLCVAPVPELYWGPGIKAMAQAAQRAGYHHAPIRRNAPECNGQNSCDMGCPSGGKYSMDMSYIPMALRAGALLLTETKLEQVLISGGTTQGARVRSGNKTITIRAPRVALCAGSFSTPKILWSHGFDHPAIGRNLTIHPAAAVAARMPFEVRCFDVLVPSPYYIDQFQKRDLMLIGVNMPLDMAAAPLQLIGDELTRQMEAYDHFSTFGAMLAETSRGRLRRTPNGQILTTYMMNQADVDRLQEGMVRIAELYFDAGAEQLFPSVRGWSTLRSRADLQRFAQAKIRAPQLILSAYHPLGTCRMGRDPTASVVDPEHRLRGVDGLYVVDASVIPGPLGINSQLTTMAFARRAADILDQHMTANA